MFTSPRTRNNQNKQRAFKLCIRKKQFLLKKHWNSSTGSLRWVEVFLHWRFLKEGKITLPFRLSWQMSSFLGVKREHRWSPVVLAALYFCDSMIYFWKHAKFLEAACSFQSCSAAFSPLWQTCGTCGAGSKTLFHLGHTPEPCCIYWLQRKSANR